MRIEEDKARELYFDGKTEGYKKVDESSLYSESKSEVGTYVVEDLKTGKHYQSTVQRSGEYWSSYEWYFDEDFVEVEQVEVVVKQWQKVT